MSPIRVLVIDDSVAVRSLIGHAIDAEPDLVVAGTAHNGITGLEQIEQTAPDVVVLDIEMPGMSGIEMHERLRARDSELPVVLFSSHSRESGRAVVEALSWARTHYVMKPSTTGAMVTSPETVRVELVATIRAVCASRRARPHRVAPASAPGPSRTAVLAVGCSTGGPAALEVLLGSLPGSLPVPVVVVQHMPKLFTTSLAERLDRIVDLHVREASDAEQLEPGTVYIAPGGRHLALGTMGRRLVAVLHDDPPENYCRPAVDVLFRSVARRVGGHALAVVLTGMGADGREGARALRSAGARILVQDADSSVVWGMPGAVASAGLADAVLPLHELGPAIAATFDRTVRRQPTMLGRSA